MQCFSYSQDHVNPTDCGLPKGNILMPPRDTIEAKVSFRYLKDVFFITFKTHHRSRPMNVERPILQGLSASSLDS